MFEEEAKFLSKQVENEERFNPNDPWDCGYRHGIEIGFQKGADFGYNKANNRIVELKKENEMLRQGYVWQDYDPGEGCYDDTHKGKWVKRENVNIC